MLQNINALKLKILLEPITDSEIPRRSTTQIGQTITKGVVTSINIIKTTCMCINEVQRPTSGKKKLLQSDSMSYMYM